MHETPKGYSFKNTSCELLSNIHVCNVLADPSPDRDLGWVFDFSKYFPEFFSYALQILHESNTSMKTCLSEKINVISPLRNILETFETKKFETKSPFSTPYEHLEISEFVEF